MGRHHRRALYCGHCGESAGYDLDEGEEVEVERCPDCGEYYCSNCAKECSCGEKSCPSCARTCIMCEEGVCDSCGKDCVGCGETVCNDCASECICCNERLCEKCGQKCGICQEIVCKLCIATCDQCHTVACRNCIKKCDHCQQLVCNGCFGKGGHFYSEQINAAIASEIQKLADPRLPEKSKIIDKIIDLQKNAVSNSMIQYFCEHCNATHLPGEFVYSDHKPFAQYKVEFPAIQYEECETLLQTQIVGIYYTHNGSYISGLARKTELELYPEAENQYDHHAVAIWHGGNKLGYLPKGKNVEVFQAILENQSVHCILGKYRESKKIDYGKSSWRRFRRGYWDDEDWEEDGTRSEFHPERADITIRTLHEERYNEIIQGMIELMRLGHPSIFDGFDKLGVNALRILEYYCENHPAPETREFLTAIYQKMQVPLEGTDLKVLL